MKLWTLAVLGSCLLTAASDPKAVEIADTMMKAMGGKDTWNRAPYVRFDFKVTAGGKVATDRAHLLDKRTGRYRLESQTKDGQPSVTLMNVATQRGSTWVNGKKLEGAAAAAALKGAYATYTNDSYWLAMPWKWMDGGVNLKYLGKKSKAGKECEMVALTFDKVGLTPGDRYEACVSPKTSLMEHWDFKLQSGQTGSWDWEYVTTGGVMLARNHVSADGKTIGMGDVKVMQSADDALFTDPAKSLR